MTQVPGHYTRTAITLHWLIAAFLLLNSAIGVVAANVADPSSRRLLLNLHKPMGILLLALIVVRIAWRLRHTPPILPVTIAAWEAHASKWSHRLLYLTMLVLPLSGWLLTSFAPEPHPIMIGEVQIPFLPVQRSGPGAGSSHTVHVASAIALAGLVTLHVLAVVHHARRGVSVLPRMLFRNSGRRGVANPTDV